MRKRSSKPIRWWNFLRRLRCPHVHVEGIFGDEINAMGGVRLVCLDCKTWLDGPVQIALDRQYLNEHPLVIYKGKDTDDKREHA